MTRPARSLWRSRRLPRLRAHPPCQAHSGSLLPGPAESALPLGGEGARGRSMLRLPAGPHLFPPFHRPLQLSLASRQPSLLWLRVLGSPNLPTFQTWLRNHQRLQAPIATNVNPRIHCGPQRNGRWGRRGRSPGSPRMNRPPVQGCGRALSPWPATPHPVTGPGIAPQALYTRPPAPHNIISQSPKQATLPVGHHSPPLRRTGLRTWHCRHIRTPHQLPGRCPHSSRGWLHRGSDIWEAGKRAGLRKLLPPRLPLAPPAPLPPQTRPTPSTPLTRCPQHGPNPVGPCQGDLS